MEPSSPVAETVVAGPRLSLLGHLVQEQPTVLILGTELATQVLASL